MLSVRLAVAFALVAVGAQGCCCTKMKFTIAGGQDTRGTETECAMMSSGESQEACQQVCQDFISKRMRGFNDGTEARGWVAGKCAGSTANEQWVQGAYCHTPKPNEEIQGTGTAADGHTITTPGEVRTARRKKKRRGKNTQRPSVVLATGACGRGNERKQI